MGRFTEKQLTIMTIVVALVITGLFGGLIFKDRGSIGDEQSTITGLKQKIRVADAAIAEMPRREKDVIVYREIVKRDSQILPEESEINKFFNIIGKFEKYSGVVVSDVHGLREARSKRRKEAIARIPVKIKLQGSTEQFLKFMNLFENYDRLVKITGFTMTAGTKKSPDAIPQHNITLDLETYQYNPRGGPVARVEIKDYDKKKQQLDIQKRIRQTKAAQIEKYPLKPRIGRRDPLVDPRQPALPEGDQMDVKEQYKHQKALYDGLSLRIGLLQADIRLEAKLKKEHQFLRLPSVSRAIDNRIGKLDIQIRSALSNRAFTIQELKGQFEKNVVRPFEKIKEHRKAAPDSVMVGRELALETLQSMKSKFSAKSYKDVEEIYEGFKRATQGRKIASAAQPVVTEMSALARNADGIQKFKDRHYHIQGVVVDPKRTSYAIIDGSIFSEGDAIDKDGKVKIEMITNDTIEFSYDGVPVDLNLSEATVSGASTPTKTASATRHGHRSRRPGRR